MDQKKIEACITEINQLLNELRPYKEVLYYGEAYWFLEILNNFLVDRSWISEKEFYKLDKISDIYEDNLYELVLYYLFVYASYHEDEKITYVLDKYPYEESRLISNQRFAVFMHERNDELIEAYKKYNKILSTIGTNYEIQKIYIYLDLANLFFR